MSFLSTKHLLLLPALLGSISVARAQAPNCAALKTENEALKDKIVAYEARLGIGVGGVRTEDGDPSLKVKFISCKASKAKHEAILTFQILNSEEPLDVIIQTLSDQDHPSQVIDEQGQTYTSQSTYPTVGKQGLRGTVPSNVPFNGTLTFSNVPVTTTRLNTVVLSFIKDPGSRGKQTYFNTTIHNMPIMWVL